MDGPYFDKALIHGFHVCRHMMEVAMNLDQPMQPAEVVTWFRGVFPGVSRYLREMSIGRHLVQLKFEIKCWINILKESDILFQELPGVRLSLVNRGCFFF